MNINQLKYFQTICKYNNITKAAKDLYISQPSLSNAMKNLEKEIGFKLLHRINKRIYLTEEGKFVLNEVNKLLNNYDSFYDEILNIGNNKKFHIKIGVPSFIGTLILPTIYSYFFKFHPNIRLEFFEYASLEATEMLTQDVIDLAFIISNGEIDNSFESKHVFETTIDFYANPNNRLSSLKSISFNEIKDVPLILLPEGSYHCNVIKKKFETRNIKPNIFLYTNQLSNIQYFIDNNIAVTLLYRNIFHDCSNIISIPLKNPINTKICLVWKKDKFLCDAATRFINSVSDLGFNFFKQSNK